MPKFSPSAVSLRILLTALGAHVFMLLVSTTGHNKMAAQSVNTCAPKAVSKILNDTADGENFGTNGRNYQTR